MNDANYTCPYCNAVLQVLTPLPPEMMLPCPRCDEPVPASRWRVDASLSSPKSQPKSTARPPGIRKTLFIVLGIMVTMSLIGLSYMLWTTRLRQSRHPWLHTKLEPIAFRQPLELTGLGYLPTNCAFVAGLHIGEMVEDAKVGKPLLADPRPVGLEWALRQIHRTTGMSAEDIDHVVLGGRDPTMIFMVVKARRKISLEKIADARPKHSFLFRDQAAYEFALQAGGFAILWQADDSTLIFVMRVLIDFVGLEFTPEEHLKRLDPKLRTVNEVIPAELREIIQQRLPKHNFVWIASDDSPLGHVGTMLALLGERNPYLSLAAKRLSVGIATIDGLTVIGNLKTDNAKDAAKLLETIEKAKLPENITRKVEVTPPEQPHHWVTLQLRGDVAAMREWLGVAKDTKK